MTRSPRLSLVGDVRAFVERMIADAVDKLAAAPHA